MTSNILYLYITFIVKITAEQERRKYRIYANLVR